MLNAIEARVEIGGGIGLTEPLPLGVRPLSRAIVIFPELQDQPKRVPNGAAIRAKLRKRSFPVEWRRPTAQVAIDIAEERNAWNDV